MLDLARNIIGTQPILATVPRHRRRLSGRPDQPRRLFARRRRGSVRRPGDRRVCAESPDHRADRPDRPDHVPLRDRHPLWAAVLRRNDRRRGPQIQSAGAGRGASPGLLVALGLGKMFGIKIGHTLGIFAGSMTSTATLQAALDVMKNSEPSIGYSIAYPFGVIGPILCIYFMTRRVQPKFPPKAQRFHMGEITLARAMSGERSRISVSDLPDGVQVTMVRKGDQNIVPAADLRLACRRRSDDRGGSRGGDRRSRGKNWETGARAHCQGSFGARLHPRLCRQGRTWSGFRSRGCRCRPAFRPICCMSVATTWTSFRHPI